LTDMSSDAVLREVTLALPMAPEMEIEASKTAGAVAASMRMSPDRIDEVRQAVIEAFINALEHSRAEDREVFLTFEILGEKDPEKLRITVRDHGVGFTPTEVREPRIEDKISGTNRRGWGLKIIRGLMDEVEIRSGVGGTIVVMSKLR